MYYEIVHAEGTTVEKLCIPTVTKVPSHYTVICTDTDLKDGTNFELSGQALQTKDGMVIDFTSGSTGKKI